MRTHLRSARTDDTAAGGGHGDAGAGREGARDRTPDTARGRGARRGRRGPRAARRGRSRRGPSARRARRRAEGHGNLTEPSTLVRDAHAVGPVLHPCTVRNENPFLPQEFRKGTAADAYGDVLGLFQAYFATGIDGVFTDNADTGLLAREDFLHG